VEKKMKENDQFNLQLVKTQEQVDQLNSEFYGRFTYPWPPVSFQGFTEQQYNIAMLNQDLGSWTHDRVPGNPKIWVAGCGTNQAVYTALRFPDSEIVGTDLSAQSLEVCRNSASQLGLENLTLERKSINDSTYHSEFDYVICTGVIHHNADPAKALERLAAALKPEGIMEIMIYNYFHTILMTTIQKATRLYCDTGERIELEDELEAVKAIMTNFKERNLMYDFLQSYRRTSESDLANALMQPVLHSYTIESCERMISRCNLEFLLHCINQFDKNEKRLTWNLTFEDPRMNADYEALPDNKRWQLGNLLLLERSPMIWFYLQRQDSPYQRKSESEVCREFLNTRFEKASTTVRMFMKQEKERTYTASPKPVKYPTPSQPTDAFAKQVYNAVSPSMTMKDLFAQLGIPPTFSNANRARIGLTTTAFPYIKAVLHEQ
jgi:SAM-dependent methyltransferase